MKSVCALVLAALVARPALAGATELGSFFAWRAGLPEPLERGLESFAVGERTEAVAAAGEVLESGVEAYRDDALLLRGLALEASEPGAAEIAYRSVLEQETVSPYHPLAALGLVRLETDASDWRGVADVCGRHVRIAWTSDDERGLLVANLFAAFGDVLTGPGPVPFPEGAGKIRESRLERASRFRDRPAERLFYLCGLGLYRAGEHRRAIDALERVGPASPYRFYALYTIAQALFRLDRPDEADRVLRSLVSAPPVDLGESMLRDRATLFRARLRVDRGDPTAALRLVDAAGRSGPARHEASLFQGALAFAGGQPALAVSYYREVPAVGPEPEIRVFRAVGLARSWMELGDVAAAREALETTVAALEDEWERLRTERAAARLREWVVERVRRDREEDAAHRRRLARGIRRVAEFEAPLHLGKLVRTLLAPHRNTVLGKPVYDVAKLASEPFREPFAPEGAGALWLAYLGHPGRPAIERAAARRMEEGSSSPGELATRLRRVVTAHRRELRRLRFRVERELSEVLAAPVIGSRAEGTEREAESTGGREAGKVAP